VAAFALIIAAVVGLRHFVPVDQRGSSVTLALGFALLAAYLLGGAAERLRLPRLSGYLVFGIVCGPSVLNVITGRMARELEVANDLALALIAFVAGLEMNASRLRQQARAVAIVSATALLGTLLVLAAVLWAGWRWLPLPHMDGAVLRFGVALITAALVTSFSPTVTLAVMTESRSRGPLTDLALAVVVASDLLLIVIFALGMQFVRWAMAVQPGSDIPVSIELSWHLAGSLAFGAIVGSLFAFYVRLVGRELTLALLAMCAALALASSRLDFELILAALAAGAVVENLAPAEGDVLRARVENGSVPVLVVFFAAAGASLPLDALATIGWLALVLAVLRLLLIYAASAVGVRVGRVSGPARLVWMGLISQAGVTIGLATLVARQFPGWGDTVRTLTIALTGLHVLIGPIVFKAALRRSGEIDAAQP
jgi:Kef-type K+ transport system membrane component KefB